MKPPPLPEETAQNQPVPPGHIPKPIGEDAGIRLLLPVGRSVWAIAAGYLGLFGLLLFPAPLALIVSMIAIWDIKRSKLTDKPKYGMGRAIFGLIVGVVGTVLLVILLFNLWQKNGGL